MPLRPIGVFDSGVGGLTVLRALREILPYDDFVYLGDMARLPYGTKSPETVANYAQQVTQHLVQQDIKMLVVACNTASALGLDHLKQNFPSLPCLGVIEPGARAAVQATQNNRVVVLATEATVSSGAYETAIKRLKPEAKVQAIACNMLVSLVEEGWSDTHEAEVIVRRYLKRVKLKDFDTLVLGCTHFPLLLKALEKVLPASISIVDSAKMAAKEAKMTLITNNLQKESIRDSIRESIPLGADRFLITDSKTRFTKIAKAFLPDHPMENVEQVDL